jgi:hypothetical protein
VGLLFGVGFLVVTWCLLVVWIGRTAMARGRSAAVWCLIGGGFGVLGITAGFMLADQLLDTGGDKVNMMAAVAALFTPVITLVLPMVAVRTVLHREPIHVARRTAWNVTVMGKGNATISVDGDQVRFVIESAAPSAEQTQTISKVEADGECVRITLGGEELIAMPLGEPATPAGRKHQSLMLAKQLRQAKSLH